MPGTASGHSVFTWTADTQRTERFMSGMQNGVAVELGLNSNLELKDIDFCIDVIKTCLPTLNYPTATQNKLTKIYRKKLELMGIDDPEPVI